MFCYTTRREVVPLEEGVKPLLKIERYWKKLRFSIHAPNDPEMAWAAKAFRALKIPCPPYKRLIGKEYAKGLIVDIQLEGKHVYLLYRSATKYLTNMMIEFPDRLTYYTLMLAYEGNAYWYSSRTGKLLTEAIEKQVNPSIYVLVHQCEQTRKN